MTPDPARPRALAPPDPMTSMTPFLPALASRPGGPADVASAISFGRPAVPAVSGRTTKALRTFCSVLVTRPAALEPAQVILDEEITAIDLACSRLRADSELSALTAAATAPPAPAPGWRCVEAEAREHTGRVPAGVRLDFGATAKALTADRAAQAITARLGCGVLVNLGGDIAVAGQPPEGGWKVGVDDGVTSAPAGPGASSA